jgi:hypothetical protein
MTPKEHVKYIDVEILRMQTLGIEKHNNAEHFRDHLERLRSTRRSWIYLYPEAA